MSTLAIKGQLLQKPLIPHRKQNTIVSLDISNQNRTKVVSLFKPKTLKLTKEFLATFIQSVQTGLLDLG